MEPDRRQAIDWTNDGPIQRYIYASPALKELKIWHWDGSLQWEPGIHAQVAHWGQEKLPLFCRWHFKTCFHQLKFYILIKMSLKFVPTGPISSSPPRNIYMSQRTGPLLVQVMACRLFSAKPLPEPKLVYCQLDPWEQASVKFEFEFYSFHSRKCIWKCRLSKWRPFCPGGDELTKGQHCFK